MATQLISTPSLDRAAFRRTLLGALEASREAVGYYRELARSRSESLVSGLATSLNNFGNRLSDLGSHEDALKATREALQLYRSRLAGSEQALQLVQDLNRGRGSKAKVPVAQAKSER